MKKYINRIIVFFIPIIIIFSGIEILLRTLPYNVSVKETFFKKNKNDIKVLALGSSHYERGINPEYLDFSTLNLGNSGQRINENFDLLKNFAPKLPNLNLVILEVSYDWLERDKSLTPPLVDHLNLIFYNTNTFQRNLKIQDHFLFPSDPDFFSEKIDKYIIKKEHSPFNKYGFDTTKYNGSYQAAGFQDSLIKDKDIFVQNAEDLDELKKNTEILKKIIKYCEKNRYNVLIYNPPSHIRYNKLRKKEIIERRDSVLQIIKNKFPNTKFFLKEGNNSYEAKYFYNGDHLNPTGAKKATKQINKFIQKNYNLE